MLSLMITLNRSDYGAFLSELQALGKEITSSFGPEDFRHLKKIERLGRLMSTVAYLTAWIIPNPITAFLMSWGNITRWCLMHHISHGGYDRVPGVPKRYTSQGFAKGLRRYIDWFDWILPEAWAHEHNILHHYNTGQDTDPDLVEKNFAYVRDSNQPMWVRYLISAGAALTWKFTYYAPNTLECYLKKTGSKRSLGWELTFKCILPYALVRFGVIPLLFLPLGSFAYWSVLINSILAELMTNLHTYLIVVPNHTGDDVARFDHSPKNRVEYYLQQITGSVNYHCGNDLLDLSQFWLNYQIEHHVWPDLPMLKYQQYQGRVKALCQKYEIPYIQENLFKRAKKMLDIMVGRTSMVRLSYLESPAP